jgi:hypothetical protein
LESLESQISIYYGGYGCTGLREKEGEDNGDEMTMQCSNAINRDSLLCGPVVASCRLLLLVSRGFKAQVASCPELLSEPCIHEKASYFFGALVGGTDVVMVVDRMSTPI